MKELNGSDLINLTKQMAEGKRKRESKAFDREIWHLMDKKRFSSDLETIFFDFSV
jgi:hypothetical protein